MDAGGSKTIDESFGEVKASRWCCDRAGLSRVDGLVINEIAELSSSFPNVWRHGNLTVPF
jgi:hypothetical protein